MKHAQIRAKLAAVVGISLGLSGLVASPSQAAGSPKTQLKVAVIGTSYSENIYDAGTSGDIVSNATLITEGPGSFGDPLPTGIGLNSSGAITGEPTDASYNVNAAQGGQICVNYDVIDGTTSEVHNEAGCWMLNVEVGASTLVLPTSLDIENSGQSLNEIDPATSATSNSLGILRLTLYSTTGTLTVPESCACNAVNGSVQGVPSSLIQVDGYIDGLIDVLERTIWTADPGLVAAQMSPSGTIYGSISVGNEGYDPASQTRYYPYNNGYTANRADAIQILSQDPYVRSGSYLAAPVTQSQAAVIKSIMISDSWIAGQFDTQFAEWYWDQGPDSSSFSDAQGLSSEFTDWRSGAPVSSETNTCLAYVHIGDPPVWGWEDTPCQTGLTYSIVALKTHSNGLPIEGAEDFPTTLASTTINAQPRADGPFAVHVNGDSFLAGQYVEVGVASNGRFGSDNTAPNGFHPMDPGGEGPDAQSSGRIGFVSDRQMDGWGVGYDDGDFFVPGDPYEGWGIQVGGDSFFNDNRTSHIGTQSQAVVTMPEGVKDIWTSTTSENEPSARDGIRVTQETYIPYNGQSLDVTVTIRNTTSETIDGIFYSRQVDADNGRFVNCGSLPDLELPGDGSYATVNTIVGQASINGASLVSSTAPDISDHCQRSDFDTQLGDQGGSYLGLFSTDSRSRVGLQDLGFQPTPPSDFIDAPNGDLFEPDCFAITDRDEIVGNQLGLQLNCDSGIGIGFDVGSLAPGDYTDLHYSYILSEDEAREFIDNTVDTVAVPVITPANDELSAAYGETFSASGIQTSTGGPIDYFTVNPTLPAGLTLNPQTGEISGTPTTAVTDNPYTLTAHNFSGSDSIEFTLSITGLPLEWIDTELLPIRVGDVYSDFVAAFSSSGITYALKSGSSLPAGLSLDSVTGEISGTATERGYYDFTILAVTDSSDIQARFRGNVFVGENSDPKLVAGPNSVCVISNERSLSCMGGNAGNNLLWASDESEYNSLDGLSGSNPIPQLQGLVSTSLQEGFGCGVTDTAGLTCWAGRASDAVSIGLGQNPMEIQDYSIVNNLTHDVNGMPIENVTQVETLPNISCAIVGPTDGISTNQVDCWGELSGFDSAPVPLNLGEGTIANVSDIALFEAPIDSHVGEIICALDFNEDVFCLSFSGDSYGFWAPVDGIDDVIASGGGVCFRHSSSGLVECWNPGGTSETIPTPLDLVEIPALDFVTDIAATTTRTGTTFCGVIQIPVPPTVGQTAISGTVSCWGMLLDGTGRQSTIPVKLEGARNVDQIAGGLAHMCLMNNTYDVSCFGQNMSWIAPTVPSLWNGQPVRVGTANQGHFVTAPSTIRNVDVLENDTELTINWDLPYTDGGNPITQYSVYLIGPNGLGMEYSSDSCLVLLAQSSEPTCSFDLPPAGSSYQFLAYAINAEGESHPYISLPAIVGGGGSNQPTETPMFGIASNPTSPGSHTGSITLNIAGADIPGATGIVASVTCECSINNSAYWHLADVAEDFDLELSTLPLNTELQIRVAYTVDGTTFTNVNFSDESEVFVLEPYRLPTVSAITVTGIPGNPTDVTGMALVDFAVPELREEVDYDAFTVEARPRSGGYSTITVVSGTHPISLSGLVIGVAYDYRVRATSYDAGTSEWTSATRATLSPAAKWAPLLPKIAASVKQAKTFKIAAATSQKLVVKVTSKTKATCTVAPIKVKKKVTGYLVKAAKLKKGKKSAVCSVLVSVTGNATYSTVTNRQVNLTVKK